MKFVVKYFSEITIKSKPVRRRFVGQLVDNLRALLRETDPDVVVQRNWDKLQIETRLEDPVLLARMVEGMRNAPGITYILQVVEHPLPDLEDIVEYVLPVGQHEFTSVDVERVVGGALLARTAAAGVRLKNPEVTVDLEISKKTLFVITHRHRGLGGYPIGSIDPVLSLISGGFDSPVASYLTMKW
jgi:thiamine biosynthesis protein ThiI